MLHECMYHHTADCSKFDRALVNAVTILSATPTQSDATETLHPVCSIEPVNTYLRYFEQWVPSFSALSNFSALGKSTRNLETVSGEVIPTNKYLSSLLGCLGLWRCLGRRRLVRSGTVRHPAAHHCWKIANTKLKVSRLQFRISLNCKYHFFSVWSLALRTCEKERRAISVFIYNKTRVVRLETVPNKRSGEKTHCSTLSSGP